MAKIIMLYPHNEYVLTQEQKAIQFSNAAWQFALCVLWPEQTFEAEESNEVMGYLKEYFLNAAFRNRAFIHFCERVILYQRYLHARPGYNITSPAIWFNPDNPSGFTQTYRWLQDVLGRRETDNNYLQHIHALARGYCRYVLYPNADNFHACRNSLIRHKAFSLLRFFYAATNYLRYNIL